MCSADEILLGDFMWLFPIAAIYEINIDSILKQLKIDEEEIHSPNIYVNCTDLNFVHDIIKNGCDKFAINSAPNVEVGCFGLLEYLCASSETIEASLICVDRYFSSLSPSNASIHFSYKENYGVLTQKHDFFTANSFPWYEIETSEFIFSLFISRMREATNCNITPKLVTFTHSKPDYYKEYNNIFRCDVLFDTEKTEMIFYHHTLKLKHINTVDKNLNKIFLRYAELLYSSTTRYTKFKYKVIQALLSYSQNEIASIDIVLDKLNITQRTLHRRLREEGTTFAELRDCLKKNAAEKCLLDTQLTITQIAGLLGYTSTSSFHRSFKRLTGTSPKLFRDTKKLS